MTSYDFCIRLLLVLDGLLLPALQRVLEILLVNGQV